MTQLELLRETVSHVPIDEFLYHARFTPQADRNIRDYLSLSDDASIATELGMYDPVDLQLKEPDDWMEPDFSRYYAEVDRTEGSYIDGIGTLHVPGSMYHFTRYISPLRNARKLDEIEAFLYPDISRFTDDHLEAAVTAAHDAGRVATHWVTHIYEDAWQIRGYEQFLMDMHQNPEICEYILDRLTERNLKSSEAVARAGVDVLVTADDVANQNSLMFSIEHWRKFVKERWAKVYEAVRAINPDIQIWYHSDGNIESIIPELIEIGVTILNPVQPECIDPRMVKEKYGDKLVLDGTIGTQTTMPFGSVDDVRACVVDRIDTLGKDGGLILSPTHTIEPEVPAENVVAFVEAVKSMNSRGR